MYPKICHTTTSKPRPNHFLFKNIQIIQPSTGKFFAMSPFMMKYRLEKNVTIQGLQMNQLLSFSHHLLPWSYKIYKGQKVYPSDILSSGSQFWHKCYSWYYGKCNVPTFGWFLWLLSVIFLYRGFLPITNGKNSETHHEKTTINNSTTWSGWGFIIFYPHKKSFKFI